MRITESLAVVGSLQFGLSGPFDRGVYALRGPEGIVIIVRPSLQVVRQRDRIHHRRAASRRPKSSVTTSGTALPMRSRTREFPVVEPGELVLFVTGMLESPAYPS